MKKYIYFDNAATTVNKPECVARAVISALANSGNPGRSGHDLSLYAANEIYSCRENICRLFGYDKPEKVIFTYNATLALNIAIKGYTTEGCHIVISNLEHNSVIRPVHALKKEKNISYSVFDATLSDNELVFDFSSKLKPQTKLAVITLASNLCGKILPVARIASICKQRGIILICDASQGAGCIPINVKSLGADVVCFAGHKSLYGPQGTGGAVFCTDRIPESIIQGGNGINSYQPEMSGVLPEILESGTLNTPGIAGLNAGISYISRIGINEIYDRNSFLIDKLTEYLSNIKGVTLYGVASSRTPTVAFNITGIPSETVAEYLNENKICVRAGLHCAPLAHIALNTGKTGAVRASLSFENNLNEIENFCKVLNRIPR